jgi:lambda family phage portal protein
MPLHADDASSNLSQGVYRNAWGRITGYQVYKSHPGDMIGIREETKFVPADRLQSVACINRIGQVRGLSIFAPVMNRFRDIQDYENSERIAAKVAASFCAQIIKDTSLLQTPSLGGLDAAIDRTIRSFNMVPGLIGDELLPGERIEVIDSKRPNPNIETYLNSQMRRAAGGLGTSFSSLSMNYNGTYSAQRQELVEKFGYYAMLGEWFVAKFVRPVWEEFVIAAVQRGLVRIPAGWTIRNIQAAHFVRPAMPWIDPLKEILARQQAVEAGWLAPQQAILQSGNDPEEVLRLREDWKAQAGDPPPTQPNTEGRAAFVALASGDPNA